MGLMPRNLGRSLNWIFRPRAQDTTASTKVLKVQNAAGTDKFTVDIEGDVACNDLAIAGTLTYGALSTATDFAVNTNKFTVAAASGNTVVAGTLGVTSDVAVNTNKFTVAASSGNTVVAGTLAATGNVAVNTNKFNVTAATGATNAAGDFSVATNKFTVASASGNTVIGGTLQSGTALSGTSLTSVKGIMTFTSGSTDIASLNANTTSSTDFALTGVAAGDVAILISQVLVSAAGSAIVPRVVCGTDTLTLKLVNNTAGALDPDNQTYSFLILDLT